MSGRNSSAKTKIRGLGTDTYSYEKYKEIALEVITSYASKLSSKGQNESQAIKHWMNYLFFDHDVGNYASDELFIFIAQKMIEKGIFENAVVIRSYERIFGNETEDMWDEEFYVNRSSDGTTFEVSRMKTIKVSFDSPRLEEILSDDGVVMVAEELKKQHFNECRFKEGNFATLCIPVLEVIEVKEENIIAGDMLFYR